MVSAVFVGGLWLVTAPLLSALGFSSHLSAKGGTFAVWSIARIVPQNLYVVINNALQVRARCWVGDPLQAAIKRTRVEGCRARLSRL
jgi:hypothetical protein